MNTSFFGEMLNSITERGRALLDRTRDRRGNAAARSESLAELCEQLLTGRGEASGVALAEEILDKYAELTTGPRIAFFEALANRFGPDRARLDAAIAAWQAAPSDKTAAEIHAAAEARRLQPGQRGSARRHRRDLRRVLPQAAQALNYIPLIPAQAGIQSHKHRQHAFHWIPACAGMNG